MAKITEAGAAPDTSVVWRWGSREEGETGNLGGGNQSSRRRANGWWPISMGNIIVS